MRTKSLKIMTFMLFLIVVGYIYRAALTKTTMHYISLLSEKVLFNAFKSKQISSQKSDRTSWNNGNFFNLPVVISMTKTITSPSRTTTLSNASSSHLNPLNVLGGGNGIIFMETTDRMQPPSLVLCAIESAARVYKDRPVVFFMKGLNETNSDATKKKHFPSFIPIKNVYIFPLRLEEVFAETPLYSWYQKVDPSQEKYWTHVSSDGCRLALIWKYGGIYMDSDIISKQQIPNQNFLAAAPTLNTANSILGFPSHHDFTWKCMEDFVRNYKGEVWGYQGPKLFSRILKTFCTISKYTGVQDIICGNITYFCPQRFYPIPFSAWKRYYEVQTEEVTFPDSYGFHLWNFMNRNEQKEMVPGSNSLVEQLYQQYCPTTYGDEAGKKTTL